MSAVSQLIDVSFKDMTNYSEDVGGDVLGIPFNHHWGPVGKHDVLTEANFFAMYPESAPCLGTLDPADYEAYSQIKRAFELGITAVEAYRVPGIWSFTRLAVPAKGTVSGGSSSGTSKVEYEKPEAFTRGEYPLYIATKYPGVPPMSLVGATNYLHIAVKISGRDVRIKVIRPVKSTSATSAPDSDGTWDLYYKTSSTEAFVGVLLEEFEGSTDPNATEDGRSVFINNVVAESEIITAWASGEQTIDETKSGSTDDMSYFKFDFTYKSAKSHDWVTDLNAFDDMLVSQATLLCPPDQSTTTRNKVLRVAKSRKDLVGVIGYPVSEPFTKDDIKKYLTEMAGVRNMHSLFVAGRESVKIFGYNHIIPVLGGFCGRTAAVAKDVCTNQCASAFTYGGYSGSLEKTLTFDEVCELHELGVISVFNSNQGPLIWGIRSLHPKQISYFGKANVVRVLAKILRQVFPVCLNAIHTDAASNPTTRSMYNNTFNNIINDEAALGNLASDSSANCLGDINSDVKTKGGQIFNLLLILHFYKLTEKIKIAVVATDSSVTAEIVS